MIPQTGSELGARRHREAVKRRVASGEGGAAIVGRRFLLSPEALREELGRLGGGAPVNDNRGPRPTGPGKTGRARELTDFERELVRGLKEI